ncbi:MAG: hypothetical protein NTU61_03915, partial [Candidatus Altiarchaeota archaeon]|nr:hypothetical protein [Candidatus Altiarchaeota archaeon]
MRVITIFLVAIVLSVFFSAGASAVRIDNMRLSPDPAKYYQDFNIKASLTGDTCAIEARFFIDDYLFSRKNVPCDAEDIDADFTENEWDTSNLNCGVHMAVIELVSHGTVVENYTQSVDIGIVPDITFDPVMPTVDRDFKITFRDPGTQSLIQNMKVKIVDKLTFASSDRDTGMSGQATYSTKNPGVYRIELSKKEYCGNIEFYVKRQMLVDGPKPTNPVVDEPITIGVPAGASLGIKVLDSKGAIYKTVFESISGGANFTISEPGNYTVVIGDLSTKYWPVNKSITVYSKPVPEIKVFPEQPAVGKTMTITVSARDVGLEGATITVTKPDGVSKELTTGSGGSVNYDGASSVGRYTVRAEKNKYETVTAQFDVYYSFNVLYEPSKPTINDTITLTVQNQDGAGVGDATVSIPAIGFLGYTDNDGKIKFKLNEPKDYEVVVSKQRYWNATSTITPCGILIVELSAYDIELGGNISISSSTCFGNPVDSTIQI